MGNAVAVQVYLSNINGYVRRNITEPQLCPVKDLSNYFIPSVNIIDAGKYDDCYWKKNKCGISIITKNVKQI